MEDRIEHVVHCSAISDLFPNALRSEPLHRVPLKHLFSIGLDGRHHLMFALVYALYSVHNDFSHSSNNSDFKTCVFQVLLDANVDKHNRRAMSAILGL